MGLLNRDTERLQRRLQGFTEAVVASFNNVKKDITLQNEWINHLHATHNELKENHHGHKSLTSAEFDRLKAWIAHLHEHSQKQEKDLDALRKSISEALAAYNKHIIELYKQSNRGDIDINRLTKDLRSEVQPDIEAIKKEIRHDLALEIRRLMDSQKEDTERLITHKIDSMPAVKEIQMVPKPSLLTYPEQKLLNQLLNEADPVTYEQLGQKTGHTINTLRVVMNSLKKRNLIEEHLLPSGIKLFNARNKERIKKIYNLDYI